MADTTFPRFDGAEVWRNLHPDAQALIGAAALELVVAWHCQGRFLDDGTGLLGSRAESFGRAADAAEMVVIGVLQQNFVDYVAREPLSDEAGFPRLPSLLGPVCRSCGCSEGDACQPFSCSWVEPDLCSACVPVAKESRTDG